MEEVAADYSAYSSLFMFVAFALHLFLIPVNSQFTTMTSTIPKKHVFLWTAFRSCSSAFERSILTLPRMQLMSEPFSASFYFGPQRQSCRYESKEADSKASYENVAREILNQGNDDNIDLLFVKDMACYMKGRLGFLKEFFQDAKHSFLIRNPKKSIPSQYRASENPEIQDSGWNYFDPQEAGFQELFEMYSFVKDNLDANPVVVDADDLLESPKQIMKEYCDRVGIKYEEHMTTWKPGEIIQAWQDVWVAWRRGALNSSGFIKSDTSSSKPEIEYPSDVVKAMEDSQAFYDKMFSVRLRLS